jgi:hypothetical protein
MKKVLILAYDFPPYVSVGGLRPYNWYRYLKEFDIEPIVVTRQWSNTYGNYLDYIAPSDNKSEVVESTEFGEIIRAPYNPNLANRIMLRHGENKWHVLRRGISAFYEFSQFLFPIGPKVEVYFAARNYLRNNKVDAIIATGDPFILFQYAKQLSEEFKTPWIADYRDPWTTNKTNFISKYIKPWNWFFERNIVRKARAITTVDAVFKRQIQEIIGSTHVHLFPNGYDPEAMQQIDSIQQGSELLRIAFVGTIYPWHPLEAFLSTVQSFLKQDGSRKLEVNFYGINNPLALTELIEEQFPSLGAYISITPRISNDILLPLLAKNNLMLLFNYYAYTGTKIYDYLGIKRKIILCFTDEPEAILLKNRYYNIDEKPEDNIQIQAEILQQTNAGIAIKNKQHLLDVLEASYTEFSENGTIQCNSFKTEQFSRKIQVEKLAHLINELADK